MRCSTFLDLQTRLLFSETRLSTCLLWPQKRSLLEPTWRDFGVSGAQFGGHFGSLWGASWVGWGWGEVGHGCLWILLGLLGSRLGDLGAFQGHFGDLVVQYHRFSENQPKV